MRVKSPISGRERVVVDGKTHPELVDHDLLIAQILGGMAIPASANQKDEQRLHLQAATIGLGRDDEQILRGEMIRLQAAMTPIQARMKEITGRMSISDLQALREVRLESYGRLLEVLSPDGRRKLNDHIEKRKQNTFVVIGSEQR
jgi:hypothetical protein